MQSTRVVTMLPSQRRSVTRIAQNSDSWLEMIGWRAEMTDGETAKQVSQRMQQTERQRYRAVGSAMLSLKSYPR